MSICKENTLNNKNILENRKNMIEVLKQINNLSYHDEKLFRKGCKNGKLKYLKLLLKVKPDIDISIWDERPFCNACEFGNLKVVKWLLKVKPNIDILTDNGAPFCFACANGQLHIIKWLIKIKPDINIRIDDDWAFKQTCRNNHINVVIFLCSLVPTDTYHFEICNNRIVNWFVKKDIVIENKKSIEHLVFLPLFDKFELCPICKINQSTIITNCNHQYCYDCISYYHKNTKKIKCPICKKSKLKFFYIS